MAHLTRNKWQREDLTVFALFYAENAERNRWTFRVEPHPECPKEEAVAVATLACSAPQLYEVLQRIVQADDAQELEQFLIEEARALLKVALPAGTL